MTEDLNNQDLFNLEDNDPFSDGDDSLDLPPLTFEKEEDEVIDIEAIPVEPPADLTVEITEAEPEDAPEKEEKEKGKGFTLAWPAFLKRKEPGEKKEKAVKEAKPPKEKKEKKEKEPREPREKREWNLQGLGPLFWTISGAIALLIAIILLIVVIVLGFNAIKIADAVNQDLVGQLYSSFVEMDEAHIKTTIPVEAEVPAQFDLLLDTNTTVTLSEDTYITSANVSLSTGGLSITNAPTDIILPAGSELPIHLTLTVPVDEMIPVAMDVEVDIPMSETELHDPFVNLQQTIQPYYMWLWSLTTKGVSPMSLPWEQ